MFANVLPKCTMWTGWNIEYERKMSCPTPCDRIFEIQTRAWPRKERLAGTWRCCRNHTGDKLARFRLRSHSLIGVQHAVQTYFTADFCRLRTTCWIHLQLRWNTPSIANFTKNRYNKKSSTTSTIFRNRRNVNLAGIGRTNQKVARTSVRLRQMKFEYFFSIKKKFFSFD